jgi:hypothetical protein
MVLRQLPQHAHNALWHLFSAAPEQVAFAVNAYRKRSDATSTLLNQLFQGYRKEGLPMPYTMADFRREYAKEIEEERREPAKELLKVMPLEERLAGVSPEEILKALPMDEIDRYLKLHQAKKKSGGASPTTEAAP